ncbi:MAG TPA: FHA domain-containing protein [Streptosporangiaceae bacterium]|nr:FHA domain-containing protein [Streptosporangiaceae bacterium]
MAGRGSIVRRPAGGPPWTRGRKGWVVAGAVAGTWLVFLYLSGSVAGGSVLLVLVAVLAGCFVVVMRSLGVGRDHPLVRPLATRPWRDGRDVLHAALRHLSQVFIVMPNGSLLAPSAIEVCMNPADVESLADLIDLSVVNAHAAEAYEAEVAACSARSTPGIPPDVRVVADPDVPAGRYRLKQLRRQPVPVVVAGDQMAMQTPASPVFVGGPAGPRYGAVAGPAYPFHDGSTRTDPAMAVTTVSGEATVSAPVTNPLLRLVTAGDVAETRVSGARAGRSQAAELMLPAEPTVSRAHARFSCTDGQWRVTGLGRNGVVLNGTPLAGEHVVRDGDRIRWGQHPDALESRVEIE